MTNVTSALSTNPIFILYQHSTHIMMPIRCTECGKSFFGLKLYKAHFERLHTEQQEKVKCNECGKQFSKYRLKIHMKLMHQERKFACHLCTYKAQTGYNLRLHINKSHLGIKEFPKYKCPHCDIDTTNLDWHIKVHHKDIIWFLSCRFNFDFGSLSWKGNL